MPLNFPAPPAAVMVNKITEVVSRWASKKAPSSSLSWQGPFQPPPLLGHSHGIR